VTPERYAAASGFHDYVATATKNADLWAALYRTLPVPDEFVERASAVRGRWHILVLSEDWCGDALNSIPSVAKLVERVPNLDLRILARDQNPDIMNAHLTNGTRSIPVVMVLDDTYVEKGWWGPRPTELQRWVLEEGLKLPKEERNKLKRQWYARDRGNTVLNDVVSLLERSAEGAPGSGREPLAPEGVSDGSPDVNL
jgi:hypothetical protein